MNAHTPFDANQDWSNPYCQNSSNDQIVDALLGNAYHVVRTVYCNLGNLKLLYDFLNQYGMVIGVQSEAELKALTSDAKYARIYGFSRAGDRQVTDYLYVEGDRTGIIPDDPEATGSWITVATSGSNGGGTSSGEGAYIPWVYSNGSATGGETSINVPDGTVGVPFIIINGDMQYVGRGFEFNVDNLSVTLAQPLEEGDEVVFLLTGVPAVPDNPHVNDWVQINWLYNNGAAVGGEQVIAIPYTFQSVPAVYKNGLRLYKGLTTESYTADPDNQRIMLTEPLATNDRLIVQIGGESQVLEASDYTLQEIARAANVKDSEVILSTDTTQVLNGKRVIYDVVSQRIYGLPTLPSNVYINAVSDGQLTYSPGNITVTLLDSYVDLALVGPGVMSRDLDKFSILQGRSDEAFAGGYTRGIAVQLNEPITGSGSPVSTAKINLIEINADRLNVVDDTSPGTKVDGFMVFHKFGGAGSKGGRHAIEAILDQTAITESSNTDRNYVGIAGTATSSIGDGGTSAANAKGAYYGGNFVGILNPGATFTQVVTGAEFNAGIKTGASANIRTGLQIGSLGNNRGGVIDAAIMFNCGPSQPAWRSGLHFGKQTGGSPLNETSRAIRIDVDKVDSVISLSSTTVVNKLIDSQKVILTPSVFSMRDSAAYVEIGSDTTAGSTQLRFRTSGTGVASDTAIICSGGNGTPNSGNFEVKAGTVTYSCSQRPNVDNVYDYGAANFRGRTAYFGTGSINTSDARHKPIQEQIPDAVLDAWSVVDWGTRFKFDDAISIKGEDGARWHFGLIAQRVEAVFAEHGIDGFSLGLLCYDEWDSKAEIIDESGKVLTPAIEAGNRYGIRYEEALSLEAALQRRNYVRLLADLEGMAARIEKLESLLCKAD